MAPGFLVNTKKGPAIFAAIPKCGQHTLKSHGGRIVDASRYLDLDIRAAFVRDPVDRLVSAFHFFRQTKCYNMCDFMSSYEGFIDWAFTSVDEHVLPQTSFTCGLYDKIVHIKNMSEVLDGLTGLRIPPQNTSERGLSFDGSYRISDIKKHDSDDYELIKKASDGIY